MPHFDLHWVLVTENRGDPLTFGLFSHYMPGTVAVCWFSFVWKIVFGDGWGGSVLVTVRHVGAAFPGPAGGRRPRSAASGF